MKKAFKYFMLVVWLCAMLTVCGCPHNEDGGSTSTEANIAGKWTWSRTDNSSCNGVSYESGTFTVTQNGSNISVYDAVANRTLTGTISGNTISFSGSFAEYGGTTNATATLTLSADKNSCSGGASWTWTGPSKICTGTKTYTAFTRTSTPPTDISGYWAGTDQSQSSAILQIYQSGSSLYGSLLVCSGCLCLADSPQGKFTGTVSGSHFTLTGPDSTFTITGSVTGDNMQTSYSTTSAFCGGVTSGQYNYGRLYRYTLALNSISVTPANPNPSVGATVQFAATGTFRNADTFDINNSVTWTSSDPSVATINSSGLATAVAEGTTNIAATSGSISGGTTLKVGP